MKNFALYGAILCLLLITAFMTFRVLDQAVEIDDLKSQVALQKGALRLMQDVSNAALPSCAVSTTSFESIATRNAYQAVSWRDANALVGPFRVKSSGTCLTEIRLVGIAL